MSSAAQIAANLSNSCLSTGPNTGAGKQTASCNSLKHGLTSKRVIIPDEDPAAFDQLHADMHADWKPATNQEATLVDRITQQAWRPDEATAAAFHANAKAFDNLRRYETAIERSYYRAMAELRKLQAERRVQQPTGSVSQKQSVAINQPAPESRETPMLKSDIPWKITSSGNKPYSTPSTPASS